MTFSPKNLSNDKLITQLKDLVRRERELLTQLLHYLKEVEQRKIYAQRGYDSLFSFMREELGYSEGSADRRIKAMRLIKDLPEVEERIATGTLSLSVAASTQRFLQKENRCRRENRTPAISKAEKLEVVNSLEGKSIRDCEQKLAELSPESALPRDKTRIITQGKVHIAFTASQALLKKIERLKALTAHQNPEGQYEKLFEKALDLALAKLDPLNPAKRGNKSASLKKVNVTTGSTVTDQSGSQGRRNFSLAHPSRVEKESKNKSSGLKNPGPKNPSCKLAENAQRVSTNRKAKSPTPAPEWLESRYIPLPIKRQVWERDQGCCQFRDKRSGKICGAQSMLEIDHKFPYVLGGEHHLANLRLMCRSHNQYRAQLLFGNRVRNFQGTI